MRFATKALPKACNKLTIQLQGNDVVCRASQCLSQRSRTGTDLQHVAGGRRLEARTAMWAGSRNTSR